MRIPRLLNRIKELQLLGSLVQGLEEYCSKLMNNVRTIIFTPPPLQAMLRWFFEEVVFLGSDFFSSAL